MNTVLLVCVIVSTVAISVAVIFLIQTLVQVRRASREAEILLKSINKEVSTVLCITENISSFVDRLSSPWLHAGGFFSGIASMLLKMQRKNNVSDSE